MMTTVSGCGEHDSALFFEALTVVPKKITTEAILAIRSHYFPV